jgi:hypothetical protein
MSMGDLSISYSLPWFLFSNVYSCPYRDLLHPFLSFLRYFFWGCHEWNCFPISFLTTFLVDVQKFNWFL